MKRRPALVALLAPSALLALIVALAATAPIEQAQGAFPGRNGKITVERRRGGDSEIYRMNPNGSDKERLTYNQAEDGGADFAPGGKRIVFSSNRDGNYEIYVMRANGTRQRRITSTPNAADVGPAFSPSGNRIVFTSEQGPPYNTDLYVMRADGTHLRRLTMTEQGDSFGAAWSPNGNKIAFSAPGSHSTGGGGIQLWVMRPDGTHKRQLTSGRGPRGHSENMGPDFSPSGKRIVLQRQREYWTATRIWVMRADGSHLRCLTRGHERRNFSPVFSPNGRKIAYNRGFRARRSVMRADGSHKTRPRPGGVSSWGVRPK